MVEFLSSEYWDQRYLNGTAGWDLGVVSPPIKAYADQLTDKSIRILIPGCGSGYEGEYLYAKGFKNVHLLDFSETTLNKFSERNPEFPVDHLHAEDFFKHRGRYDLIIEQTLFCAIDPKMRIDYAAKVHDLLGYGGKVVGLLFNREFEGGPPFGGYKEEYEAIFGRYFSKIYMEPCYNSIPPRSGSELFFQLIK